MEKKRQKLGRKPRIRIDYQNFEESNGRKLQQRKKTYGKVTKPKIPKQRPFQPKKKHTKVARNFTTLAMQKNIWLHNSE